MVERYYETESVRIALKNEESNLAKRLVEKKQNERMILDEVRNYSKGIHQGPENTTFYEESKNVDEEANYLMECSGFSKDNYQINQNYQS